MVLRHNRVTSRARVTSRTESPVVVQPLTDSKTAHVKSRPSTDISGKAETRQTTSQLSSTMTLPSCKLRSMSAGRSRRQRQKPLAPRATPGTMNDRAKRASSGRAAMARMGVSISKPARPAIIPV
jgi:hypothetical protein